jgi:Flp pilus assembly protein TadB
MQPFLLFLMFITFMLIFYCVITIVFYKKDRISERLSENVYTIDSKDDLSGKEYRKLPFRVILINTLTRILPHKNYLNKIRKKLVQANVLIKPEEFFCISVLTGALVSVIIYILIQQMLIALFGFVFGFFIPHFFVDILKKNRAKRLNAQLPEALNIISNGIRAGYSFTQSIAAASKELLPPISDEFQKVIRDNSLGKDMEEALLSMSERTEDEDMDMFITALIIQRQVGGNLSEILDTISSTIRNRIKIKGEIRTLTSQGKFSAWIISIVPICIAIAIMVLNPTYISLLLTNTVGNIMLIMAVLMEIIGIILLKKVVTINL